MERTYKPRCWGQDYLHIAWDGRLFIIAHFAMEMNIDVDRISSFISEEETGVRLIRNFVLKIKINTENVSSSTQTRLPFR